VRKVGSAFLQPPLERRFEFNEAPQDLQLSYSMILDTLFVKAYSPQPFDRGDFDRNWKMWFNGDPKKGGFGVKVEVAVSMSNHPRLLWFNVAPAGTQDARSNRGNARRTIFAAACGRNGADGWRNHVSRLIALPRASAPANANVRPTVGQGGVDDTARSGTVQQVDPQLGDSEWGRRNLPLFAEK
jgi:hypothetical protein